jgi:hypothetical protein
MTDSREREYRNFLFGLFGVVCAVVVGRPVIESFREPSHPVATPVIKLPRTPERVAQPHLNRAEKETERAIDEYIDPINVFFSDSKKNTRGFAEEALSWGSKWRLMVNHVPFTSGGRHERFIRLKFEEYIFSTAQLQQAVEQAVSGYLARVRSIESKMLVDLRADVTDFPSTYVLAKLDDNTLQAEFDQAISQAIQATGSNLQGEVGTQLVSIIVSEVFTQVALRLGVSAGVIGTGAAAGWMTLGIGAVVGLIVDQIVSWVWNWYADPKGSLSKELDNKIDQINRLIVDGSDDVQGLRARLTKFAKDRAPVRSNATLRLLHQEQEAAK